MQGRYMRLRSLHPSGTGRFEEPGAIGESKNTHSFHRNLGESGLVGGKDIIILVFLYPFQQDNTMCSCSPRGSFPQGTRIPRWRFE